VKRGYQPADLNGVRAFPLQSRRTKVSQADFARIAPAAATVSEFLDSLPRLLKANDLRAAVDAIAGAHRAGKPVVVGIGGSVVKCGLAPWLLYLMERGVITAVAMNGGASIHDFEIALIGRTSEEVAEALPEGMFGMVRETAQVMNEAIASGARDGTGMGEALGRKLLEMRPPFLDQSLLAAGVRLGTPVTVHVAVGGETLHMHASASGADLGATSFHDFRLLVSVLGDLGQGGVYLNIGSAVVLPEVFLKALNTARNLAGTKIEAFTTINMDMIQQYRATENVVRRPTFPNGTGYCFTGHHEIMVPLLFHLVRAELESATAVSDVPDEPPEPLLAACAACRVPGVALSEADSEE